MVRGLAYVQAVIIVFGQKRLAPTSQRWNAGAIIENRTTRDMRRYDLLETSLPQQRGCRGSSRRRGSRPATTAQ